MGITLLILVIFVFGWLWIKNSPKRERQKKEEREQNLSYLAKNRLYHPDCYLEQGELKNGWSRVKLAERRYAYISPIGKAINPMRPDDKYQYRYKTIGGDLERERVSGSDPMDNIFEEAEEFNDASAIVKKKGQAALLGSNTQYIIPFEDAGYSQVVSSSLKDIGFGFLEYHKTIFDRTSSSTVKRVNSIVNRNGKIIYDGKFEKAAIEKGLLVIYPHYYASNKDKVFIEPQNGKIVTPEEKQSQASAPPKKEFRHTFHVDPGFERDYDNYLLEKQLEREEERELREEQYDFFEGRYVDYSNSFPQRHQKNNWYLFFDTETTGLPKDYDAPLTDFDNWPRLVQLSWILTDSTGIEMRVKDYIIKPEGFNIPEKATKLHGITTDLAKSKGSLLQKVLEDFIADVEAADVIVGHNVEFDKKIVEAELLRCKIDGTGLDKPTLCTMKLSTNYCRLPGKYGYKWPTLQELHNKLFEESFEDAHNSLNDIKATKKCFFELLERGIIRI